MTTASDDAREAYREAMVSAKKAYDVAEVHAWNTYVDTLQSAERSPNAND
jgi:hypothetical protein